jgi:hypothetical protein
LHPVRTEQPWLLINLLALLVYNMLERELRQRGLPWTTRRLIEQLENLTIIETQCWDGSAVCRLTPVSDEQRQLMDFLSVLVSELRLPRFRLALTGPSEPLILPAPPAATLGQVTLAEIA